MPNINNIPGITQLLRPDNTCPACTGDGILTDCCGQPIIFDKDGDGNCTECLQATDKFFTHDCPYCQGTGQIPGHEAGPQH